MSERVSMPALGESVTEGTVTRWLKSVGDEVEVDEPLLEVSTDKVDTEIPSPVAGVLQEILAEEDETVEVGGDLAVIGDGAEAGGSDSGNGESESDEDSSNEDSSDADSSDEEEPASAETDDEPAAKETSSSDGSEDSSKGSDTGERVTMPALGESVTEGTVTRWLKEEGDDVEVDEPLLEVSTDKVDTEIPSPVAGKLTKILAAEDETVEVGGDLAMIGGDTSSADDGADSSDADDAESSTDDDADSSTDDEVDSSADDETSSDTKEESEPETPKESASSGSKSPEPSEDDSASDSASDSSSASKDVSAYVTPLVRKLAAKHSVDLDSIEGTGVGGRIRKQDVLDAAKASESANAAEAAKASEPEAAAEEEKEASSPSSAPATSASTASTAPSDAAAAKRGTTEKMSRLRKVIATRMVESLQVSAQLTTVVEVDVTKVAMLRTGAKEDFLKREGVKLSFMPFFALAAVDALKAHPVVNSSIDGDEVVFHSGENLGIAVDTPKGLIVPVIKDAGDLNVAGLARKIADLAERTRTNKIGPDELGGGTFTLTNTGSRGALFDTPILNQPQVGILGTGSVVRRPVVKVDEDGGETIAIRSMVYLALTYDHCIVDGADAARFLSTVKARLEEASFEV